MPLLERLREFLQANQAAFTHSIHQTAFSARDAASAEHLPAREVAKTVVVHSDIGYAMLVVPANKLIDFQEVRLELGFKQLRMVTEFELGKLFPDCELGAMPPVGALYMLPVYLDASMADERLIAFNAGTHRDFIHMLTAEYRRLVRPVIVPLVRAEATHGW
jgi:Ala-tRNA(Pro) deacylase